MFLTPRPTHASRHPISRRPNFVCTSKQRTFRLFRPTTPAKRAPIRRPLPTPRSAPANTKQRGRSAVRTRDPVLGRMTFVAPRARAPAPPSHSPVLEARLKCGTVQRVEPRPTRQAPTHVRETELPPPASAVRTPSQITSVADHVCRRSRPPFFASTRAVGYGGSRLSPPRRSVRCFPSTPTLVLTQKGDYLLYTPI